MSLAAPSGWTVRATSPSSFARVAPGTSVTTTWTISLPAGTAPGSYGISALAGFTDAAGRGSSSDATTDSVPYPSVAAAISNAGISDDSNPAAANLDGGGQSYSAQALAAATPSLTPAATISHQGLTFTWPSAQPGTPDNIVAGGQTLPLSGSGSRLGFLGAADYGAASGTVTVTYTDGSSESSALGFADWWANAASSGGDILTTVPYLNTATGHLTQSVSIYYASVPLTAGKTVKYVTLPDVSTAALSGQTAMHIFAMAFG
jgi:beta-glucosidase